VRERALIAAVAVHPQDVGLDAEDDRVGAGRGGQHSEREERESGGPATAHERCRRYPTHGIRVT
jgi:hypothetical protein